VVIVSIIVGGLFFLFQEEHKNNNHQTKPVATSHVQTSYHFTIVPKVGYIQLEQGLILKITVWTLRLHI